MYWASTGFLSVLVLLASSQEVIHAQPFLDAVGNAFSAYANAGTLTASMGVA